MRLGPRQQRPPNTAPPPFIRDPQRLDEQPLPREHSDQPTCQPLVTLMQQQREPSCLQRHRSRMKRIDRVAKRPARLRRRRVVVAEAKFVRNFDCSIHHDHLMA
jgi:hypothetical protein